MNKIQTENIMQGMIAHIICQNQIQKASYLIKNTLKNHTVNIEFIFNGKISGYNNQNIFILVCKNKMDDTALSIINTIHTKLKLEYKDSFGKTALNYATENCMKNVVVAILELEKLIKMIDLL